MSTSVMVHRNWTDYNRMKKDFVDTGVLDSEYRHALAIHSIIIDPDVHH